TPIDTTILSAGSTKSGPMIASTYSQTGDLKTAYVFVYPEKDDQTHFHFTAADVGLSGDVCVYDWKTKTAKKLAAGEAFSGSFDGKISTSKQDPTWSYFIVAPIGKSGIALIGDTGKFASMGSQRIDKVSATGKSLQVSVRFASDEKTVTLLAFGADGKTFTQDVSRPSDGDTAEVTLSH